MLCRDLAFILRRGVFQGGIPWVAYPGREWVTVRAIRVKDAIKYQVQAVSNPLAESEQSTRLAALFRKHERTSGLAGISQKWHRQGMIFLISSAPIMAQLFRLICLLLPIRRAIRSIVVLQRTRNQASPRPFPAEPLEYFIRMLTDAQTLLSIRLPAACVTGEAAEKTKRKWICCELVPEYVEGALGRFQPGRRTEYRTTKVTNSQVENFYRVFQAWLYVERCR